MEIKVLIVSHNVLSETSNMGRTLANFFRDWDSSKIAQLYLHSEVPTVDICKNYYRITDFDNIKQKKRNIGTIFKEKDINKELKTERVDKGKEAQVYQFGRQRKPYMYIGRNLIWSLKKWKNEKLLKWIDDFNPDVIFFASGDYIFSFKIAMEIAKYKNIPIVTYVCDDYYFVKRKSISPLYYINRIQYSKTIKKLFSKNKHMFAICDKITNDYEKEFNINSKTVMTVSTLKRFEEEEKKDSFKISYIGNLGLNRHIQIVKIGQVLKEISDNRIFLDVYSTENREEITALLTEENGIRFHGGIPYNEVIAVMKNSNVLVHTEAFDEVNKNKVRYSVSTKIADSLSCGRCLFAYGPQDVASIEYLLDNDCACVATSEEMLSEKLRTLVSDINLRESYVNKALNTANKNHDLKKNSDEFYEYMKKVVEEHQK